MIFDDILNTLGIGGGGGADPSAPSDGPQSPNAFERVFNPSQPGTVAGLVGNAFGVPTAAERVAPGDAYFLKEMANGVQNGLTPQQSVLKVVQSPEGMKWMSSGLGDFQGTLDRFRKLITPEQPTMNAVPAGAALTSTTASGGTQVVHDQPNRPVKESDPNKRVLNMAPGHAGFEQQPNGDWREIARNSTTKGQEFGEMVTFSNMDPQQAQSLAALHAQPSGMQKNIAIDNLVRQGTISSDQGELMKADATELKEMSDPFTGAKTLVLANKADGSITQIRPKGSIFNAPQQPSGLPGDATGGNSMMGDGGAAPKDQSQMPQATPIGPVPGRPGQIVNNPSMTLPADRKSSDRTTVGGLPGKTDRGAFKGDMILGSGPIASAAGALSLGMEMVNPAGAADKAIDTFKTQLYNVRSAMVSLREQATGFGLNTKLIQDIDRNMPGEGLTSIPQTGRKLLNLIDITKRQIDINKNDMNDPAHSIDQRKKAEARLSAWTNIDATLPSKEEVYDTMKRVKEGKAGTIAGTVKDSLMNVGNTRRSMQDEYGNVKQELGMDGKPKGPPKNPRLAPPARSSGIEKMNEQQLIEYARTIPKDKQNAPLVSAIRERAAALLAAKKAAAGGGALPYDLERAPQGQSVAEFTQNPEGMRRPAPTRERLPSRMGNLTDPNTTTIVGPERNAPPIPGARMGSDGEWYVLQNGKPFRIKFGSTR